MIVYSATKSVFSDDILSNQIVEKIQDCLKLHIGRFVGPSEVRAFRNSLRYMDKVLQDQSIPADSGISIEYQIPQTGKRIDFIVIGKDENARDVAILIELKQWEFAEISKKDAVVSTMLNGKLTEVSHPSYQAWSYAALLEDFNETVRNDNVLLKPCAYLHNYEQDDVITNSFYAEHLEKSPVFLKSDAIKLREFIKKYVKRGDSGDLMYRIDHGRIRPSKSLADKLSSLLQGNQEFIMIDDQKVVYETALSLVQKSLRGKKQVLIVEGGPGTGKSVVAVNLLVTLINQELNAQYVTKNAAPRAVYESKLAGTLRRTRIASLFSGSGAYTESEENIFDAFVVDEAHRLNKKSGMFQNKGENQIKEIINSAKFSVFFIDEDQKVTLKDIGDKEEIINWAMKLGATVNKMELSSQFRCNGSDGYIAWLDNTLQIRETVNTTLDNSEYDFRIVGSPTELRDLIYEKNKIKNKARLVAGYCWDWVSKARSSLNDIVIPEYNFAMRWNLASDGNLWILQPESVQEIGCIHTCQGLELDYIGVIVGEDLICRDGVVMTDPTKRSSMDSSVKGFKKLVQEDPKLAKVRMDAIIKNTYRTLMTRGMKGCYVYFVDKEAEQYFRSRLGTVVAKEEPKEEAFVDQIEKEINEALKYVDYLPVYSLEAACGKFNDRKDVKPQGWIKVRTKKWSKDTFVVHAVGHSMNPLISDGDLCIFKAYPVGPYTGQGRAYLFKYQGDADSETGGSYTIKGYRSNKGPDGVNTHVELVPRNKSYEIMIFKGEDEGNTSNLSFVAEFIEVLLKIN